MHAFGTHRLRVDVPGQLREGIRRVGGAVDVDKVADFVAGLATDYVRAGTWDGWRKGGKSK